jgi:hypothetical protein
MKLKKNPASRLQLWPASTLNRFGSIHSSFLTCP